ncbi:MAG: M14 family metallopeptidase [Acidobacteriota bacterium]
MRAVLPWIAVLSLCSFTFGGVLPEEPYDPSIPAFKQVLGAELGQQIASYEQVRKYLDLLDSASDRVRLFTDGKTVNGRELMYLALSDPANLARHEAVRDAVRAVYEGGKAFPADQPVTVAIYGAVHGDEISPVEACMGLAYYLAASRSDEVTALLKDEIVLIDPLQNPDGRERWLAYHETMRTTKPIADQNAAEHSESWPSGRGNGCLFDMNRDWFTLSQPETRARVRRYAEWLPQVLVDLHEMGGDSTYFFPPPSAPVNQNVQPELVKLFETFGRANAAAFDRKGVEYFAGEIFDEFFPGYGSSWPLYFGTVGMTYEQAGISGLVFRRSTGEIVRYEDAVAHHFTAALTTCRAAAENRSSILDSYTRTCRRAIEPIAQGHVRAYVFPPQPNLWELVSLLKEQGVRVQEITGTFVSKSAVLTGDAAGKRGMSFPKGSVVVPIRQPARYFVQAVLEPHAVIDERFVESERERKKHRLDSEIYDITGWSLPFCFNLSAYSVHEDVPDAVEWKGPAAGGVEAAGTDRPYAYVIDYSQNGAAAVAAGLIRDGFTVEIAEKSFAVKDAEFSRGSYVIRTSVNPPLLRKRLDELLSRFGVKAHATTTGYTDRSIDLGSPYVRNLRNPRIAVLMDSPVQSTSYGAIRWLLESQYGIEFTPIKAGDLSYTDLRPYRTIVIPAASARRFVGIIGEDGVAKLKRWVESGGTLVAIKGAAEALLGEQFGIGGGKVISSYKKDTTEPAPPKKKDAKGEEPEPEGEFEAPTEIPGTLYRVELDTLDWLTAGYSDSVPVFIFGSTLIDWPSTKDRCVGRFPRGAKISGFSWDLDDKRLEGKAYLARVEVGDGQAIVFADDPCFRGYMRGLDRLFLNAAFNAASYVRSLDY